MTTSNAVTVESAGISASEIASNPTTYYGATVNYTVADSEYQSILEENGITWKIFYVGSDYSTTGSHIYLIASDYVPRTCLPASSAGHSLDASPNFSRAAYFSNILSDYTGSASITSSELKKLNNSYFSQGYSSTYNNMKAVAYMMDTSTSVWGKYANSTYADYAIGGPPIEMLMTSYGQKYNKTYQVAAISKEGYKIGSSDDLSTSDNLYVITSTTDAATEYWVSSPGYNSSGNDLVVVNYYYFVSSNHYNSTVGEDGFRPLVCLSSNVKLVDNRDGTYNLSK